MLVVGSLCLATSALAQSIPCDQISGLLATTTELRSLDSTGAVRCISLNNSQFNELAKNLESKRNTGNAVKAQAILFKTLGIIPDDFPYESCLSTAAGENHSAFYDRTSKQIVLRVEEQSPDYLLVHELTHALQDQYFNLSKLHRLAMSSDSDQAISAIIEGDAVFQEERFEKNSMKTTRRQQHTPAKHAADPRCKPPEPLYSITMFPYEWGLRFAAALYQAGGQDLINKAFARPALTSRDILYPGDFLMQGRRTIRPIKPSTTSPPQYRLLLRDTLGEFTLRNLLKQFTGMESGVLAAKGWAGDLIELYQNRQNRIILRWQIKMESDKDTQALIAALKTYCRSRFGIQISAYAPSWTAINSGGYQLEVLSIKDTVQLTISN